jgi:hypothetical protein
MKKNIKPDKEQYVNAAIAHHELLLAGDPKGSNRAHKTLHDAVKRIRAYPDNGISLLAGLLLHTHASVRFWAAVHLLPLNEKLALQTLNKIAQNPTLYPWQLHTDAELTIKEWKAGNLKPDWFMKAVK